MDIPITRVAIEDLDFEKLEAGVLNRLIHNPLERYYAFLEASDLSPISAKIFASLMNLPASRKHCVLGEIENIFESLADFEALEYLERAASHGQPYSVSDFLACVMLIHDRSIIRRYNDSDGERATQAWVDSVEASLAYDPEEFEDRPDDE